MKKITYRALSGYKYELLKPYSHQTGILPVADIITQYVSLLRDGTLIISERYAWDGPSGPTFDTKNSLRASLVHDALYQLLSLGLIGQEHRQRADELLRDVIIEDSQTSRLRLIWKARAWTWYYAVRWAAARAAAPDGKAGENPTLEAP